MMREASFIAGPSPLGRKTNRFRARSLAVAAVGLASSGFADNASATIIYDLTLNEGPGDTFSVDGSLAGTIALITENAGMMQVNLWLEEPAAMMSASTVQLAVTPEGGLGSTGFLTLLNAGDTIDGSLGYGDRGYMVEGPTINPTWAEGVTGYAGFVFDNGSGPLYGWLQIRFDSDTDFTVLQVAYEDSGAAIAASQLAGAPIPEPSTAVLLSLGLVGISVFFRKRRRPKLRSCTA